MEYYVITSEDLEEKNITDEGLSKIVDFTGYEDVRAELIRRGVSEEKLTDEMLNLVRLFLWKNENPTRASEIIDFLDSNDSLALLDLKQ